MLDSRRLRILVEVARRGTIAATAEALAYTPSAISQQLTSLEREVGAVLLERDHRGAHLTEAGEALVAHAAGVLQELERAEAAVEAATRRVAGRFVISAFESFALTVVPPALTSLAQRHPDLEVHLVEMEPGPALDALQARDVDLALVLEFDHAKVPTSSDVAHEPVLDEEYWAVLPREMGLTRPPVLDLADLADQPWIAAQAATGCGIALRMACVDSGFDPDVVHVANGYDVVVEFVRAGRGVSLVPDMMLNRLPEGVTVHRLARPYGRRTMAAVRCGAATRPTVAAVVAALREAAEACLHEGRRPALGAVAAAG
jgi:DNA-binding transcriptional LysR family regulator